jgi:hypothetical protein
MEVYSTFSDWRRISFHRAWKMELDWAERDLCSSRMGEAWLASACYQGLLAQVTKGRNSGTEIGGGRRSEPSTLRIMNFLRHKLQNFTLFSICMIVDEIWTSGGKEHTAYVCAKTPVSESVYSVDETFEWSLPFCFCSEHGIVRQELHLTDNCGVCQYEITSLTVLPLL